MKINKILKIIFGIVIFVTLPTLLLYGYVYFKYNEELPTGVQGEQADALANKMLDALDYEAFKTTDYIEWSFKKRHFYKWKKSKNICEVYWKDYKVTLNLEDHSQSKAFVHSFKMEGEMANELLQKAVDYFNNDSFWLVAPYKVFDPGVERRLIKLEGNQEGLLVTYKSGGSTPGDSYLWILDKAGKPRAFKMWVSILPIKGLEASWIDWTTTATGAQIPTFHKLLVLGLEIDDIKVTE